MQAHDDAFNEMKKYYNDITKANLQLINQLKSQIAEANEKVAANQKLMREIADQNARLKGTLEVRVLRRIILVIPGVISTTPCCRLPPAI